MIVQIARFTLVALALSVTLSIASSGWAGTIMKLDLGSDPSFDVEFDGTTFSTVNDGMGLTAGEQNTDVEFGDFLSAIPDIVLSTASVTLDSLNTAGAPTVFGSLVIQPFSGGTVSIYDNANVLLLSGTLGGSVLTGAIGPPATGAFFTTTFANINGGALAPQLAPNSLSLSFSLTDVNSGSGFSLTGGVLNAFAADAALSVAADQFIIPEPGTLLLSGLAVACAIARHRRP